MELTERKLAILHAIIDDYILTGIPIGSRTISKRSGMNLSSATIRNEMADLEEEGYLEQPHASAGRMPSEKAYRLYVNMLMQVSQLNDAERRHIEQYYNTRMGEVESVIETTARVLSEMTNLTSVVLTPQLLKTRIRRVQIVKLSQQRAVVLFVLSTGEVRDVVVNLPGGIGDDYLEMLSQVLTERISGRPLHEAVSEIACLPGGELAEHRELLNTLMLAAQSSEEAQTKVVLGGAQNIFNHPEYQNVEKAKGFLALLDTREPLYEMLSRAMDMELTVRIGAENEIEELKDMSVVTATYKIGNKRIGSFGVIGPTRMNYAKVISVLRQVGDSMNEILRNILTDRTD